ncbi:elongation factor G [candidate division KSB1 bacterium]|nr:elongation factor G [candidate division KSB1 bacterium]
MKDLSTEKIRNIALLSHGGVGKTSLAEALAFCAGVSNRLGNIEDGTTISDYSQDEIERKVSISSSMLHFQWQKHKLNLIDTPGYFDFVGEVVGALRVVDSAIVLVDAAAGIEVGTESNWQLAAKSNLPRLLFVNKVNREHANFDNVVEAAQQRFGHETVILQFPVNQGEGFDAIIDLVKMKMLTFADDKSGKYTESEIPAEFADRANELRSNLEETIAENDEALLEKFCELGELEHKEFINGLRNEVINQNIFPVLCGSATRNIGVQSLIDFIITFCPSPIDMPEEEGLKPNTEEKLSRPADITAPTSIFVFKINSEMHIGELSFFKVISGELKPGSDLLNTTQGANEKIGQIFSMNGRNRSDATSFIAGDIGATVKLKSTHTGDTLCEKRDPIVFAKIAFPEPVIRVAVEPKTKGDEEKIGAGLSSIHEEDPTFVVKYDPEIKQTVMSGQGELQLDIVVKRLKEKYGVEVNVIQPKIPYLETIRAKVEAQGKFKKQSGGRGQYGDCHLRIEPLPRGEGFVFSDEIVGGVIPGKYIPAVEKGVRETMEEGVLAGYRVVDIKVAVYYGSYHSVDSSDMAFKIAASMGFKKAFMEAKPMLLEPIYNIEVTVPEEYMGDVMGDISSRRGKIQGMEAEGPFQIIKAKVPLAELYKYSTTLRSLTQGRGLHRRSFSHYEQVPNENAEKIIAESQKHKEN